MPNERSPTQCRQPVHLNERPTDMGSSYSELHPLTRVCYPPLDETSLSYITMGVGRRRTCELPAIVKTNQTNPFQAPWEIFRLPVPVNPILNASRIVDTYSKSGDIGLYSTFFGLVPDYNVGISVLAAGDSPNRQVPPIRGTLVDIFFRAAEAAAKEQARASFTGTFAARRLNSSITLSVDDGPGVLISQWTSNSTNFLANFYYQNYDDFRLYPTTLTYKPAHDTLTYHKYHLVSLANGGEPVTGDPWSEFNDYWLQLDGPDYNNLAADAFVVGIDGTGRVMSVESQALRAVYYRVA